MTLDLIPAVELRVDLPDFKAGAWKPATIRGEPWEASKCFELIGGRWEGFVAIRRAHRGSRRVPKTRSPSC